MADASAPLASASTTSIAAASVSAGASAPTRRVLLVTADDLGYAPERDAGIIRGFEQGAISQASVRSKTDDRSQSASILVCARRCPLCQSKPDVFVIWLYLFYVKLLVTGPSAASAVTLAKAARRNRHEHSAELCPSSSSSSRGLPLGLHFNLTEGRALSAVRDFPGKAGLWDEARVAPCGTNGSVLEPAFVLAELRAQLDRFVDLVGEQPGYVDGHNHIHVRCAQSRQRRQSGRCACKTKGSFLE